MDDSGDKAAELVTVSDVIQEEYVAEPAEETVEEAVEEAEETVPPTEEPSVIGCVNLFAYAVRHLFYAVVVYYYFVIVILLGFDNSVCYC